MSRADLFSASKKAEQGGAGVAGAITPIKGKIGQRESKELVIALGGAVGSGVNQVGVLLADVLTNQFSYSVEKIKISDLILKLDGRDPHEFKKSADGKGARRYAYLQAAGNRLREEFRENDILASLVAGRILINRDIRSSEKGTQVASVQAVVPERVAYIIDQLKHPEEVQLLRAVYGNLFYLVGALAAEPIRKSRLIEEGMTEAEAVEIMSKDRKESIEHGQQLDKTLELSDLFLRNSSPNTKLLKGEVERFVRLIHGSQVTTPTAEEFGMYAAYSASLKSACLSRQVGAAILNKEGAIIATGSNDVPKFGGGLYGAADQDKDYRCYNYKGGKCFNDKQKDKVEEEIVKTLSDASVPEAEARKYAEIIRAGTRLRDLIEFSRAVHAEMDAIISIARSGGESLEGTTLFSTTFPCHSCARHIVAAGIETVYYVEPYEKSLALGLHDDSIISEVEDQHSTGKVRFLHFEGVSPRRYQDFFNPKLPRKNRAGDLIVVSDGDATKRTPQYLDSYKQIEAGVAKHLNERFGEERVKDLLG